MSEFNAKYILAVNNYSTIHRSRNNDKNGAGAVALLIRNDLKFSECNLFEALNLEIVAINTRINEKEVCVVSYYNPPNSKLNEKVLEILKKEEVEYIIMGDLNAKSTLWGADKNNENGDILDNLILENDCLTTKIIHTKASMENQRAF
jgi:exonuclease III